MEPKQIDLYEFLVESELQQYYNSIKNELKISNASHLKYATDEDLKQIGLSRPEIRRLRKFYEKYYPHGYLSKIKRLLQNPNKKDDGQISNQMASNEPVRVTSSPNKAPSNKHIIPADSITVNKQLGTGEFGIVQQGVWTNGAERIQVAIKCLCRERMQSNPMEFLKEAAIMHAIEHENIVRLYGVVLDTDSLMLVTELAHLRSLLECLKDPGLRVSFLTVPTLCEFAMQICNGMMYLENKRLIHRDLAARNILVFSKNKVKISDFGLSRALGVGKDYYKTNFNVNLKLPIAWCAPECINYLRFTNASDVWAFGVCLWEMFSYGFQPWAALTGLQVLEAIDEPNYQRLEQPECCPKEYYNLMLKCWQHDPNKRPKFTEIYSGLPDMKPEQLKTIVNNCESKKDHLLYRQGEIITVLDKATNTPYWKGVLNSGKTGLFNPANTVAYLEGLPSCTNRDSFSRTSDRSSKRKLRTEMISMPQNDLKHTGHVGIDGAYFGDVAFIASSQTYNHLPRQIVTPYKPSEDIEQTPLLLPPTPTSPDSLQTASGYFPEEITTSSTNPTFINSNENTPKHQTSAFGSSFDFPPPVQQAQQQQPPQPPPPIFSSSNPFAAAAAATSISTSFAMQNNNYGLESNHAFTNANLEDDTLSPQDCIQKNCTNWSDSTPEAPHEYHEISDDEITTDKVFDLGPSLLDEINSMFGSISTNTGRNVSGGVTGPAECSPKSPDFEHTNKKNEITELTSKLNRKNSGSDTNGGSKSKKKTAGHVKNISVKDEKILNQAIEIANEISARSMTDLVADHNITTQSPKRKFSFRFPNLHHHGSADKDGTLNGNTSSHTGTKERKNFTEELKSIPDLQNSITEEGREAYNSLIERKTTAPPASLIGKFDTNEFKLASAKTLPRKLITTIGSGGGGCCEGIGGTTIKRSLEQENHNNDQDFCAPTQQAPRPTTLPYRGGNKTRKSDTISDTNPLRILRDKNFPLVRSRPKILANDRDNENINPHKSGNASASGAVDCGSGSDKDSVCESPSYMTNTSYTFPECKNSLTTIRGLSGGLRNDSISGVENSNPIPLPPRDRTKIMQTNQKRHVRKHPLIIPAYGVQRTLNKVTEVTPVDEKPKIPFPGTQFDDDQPLNHLSSSSTPNHNYNLKCNNEKKSDCIKMKKVTQEVVSTLSATGGGGGGAGEGESTVTVLTPNIGDEKYDLNCRNYENVEDIQINLNENNTDSASLHFESILEDDFNKVDVVASPDVVDGFCPFSIQKEEYHKSKELVDFDSSKISGLYVNEDELRNLDLERKRVEFIQKHPKYFQSDNELANHALFNKVRENVDNAMQQNSNCDKSGNNNNNNSNISSSQQKSQLLENKETNVASSTLKVTLGRPPPPPVPVPLQQSQQLQQQQQQPQQQEQPKQNHQQQSHHHQNLETAEVNNQDYFDSKNEMRLKDSNSVSCEDLLEFSEKKPKGCERGVDSDEVRIMLKVLGKDASPDRCLASLEFIQWDVHKAIKLIKLQNILSTVSLTLQESFEALQKYDWDLQITVLKLKGLK